MKKGQDLSSLFGGINIIHQNVPNKKHTNIHFPEHILFIPLQGEISLTIDSKIIKLGPGQSNGLLATVLKRPKSF